MPFEEKIGISITAYFHNLQLIGSPLIKITRSVGVGEVQKCEEKMNKCARIGKIKHTQ